MALVSAGAADSSSGWRTLPLITNGSIDPSWVHVGTGGFVVDEGSLRTAPVPQGMGLLVFQRERFGNCQIRVVFKAKDAKSNAGVYVRLADGIVAQVGKSFPAFDRAPDNKPSAESLERVKAAAEREEAAWFGVHQGYEVQIQDSGDAFHRTGAIYSLAPSSATPKPGEWRTMIITLAGEKIFVDVDGKRVTRFDPNAADIPPRKSWSEPKREPKRPVSGYIGLQTHDPGDVVWYKEVSVRALPAEERAAK